MNLVRISLLLALKQPDTVQIFWEILGGGNSEQTKEQRSDVILDKGMLGAEYALVHMMPDF